MMRVVLAPTIISPMRVMKDVLNVDVPRVVVAETVGQGFDSMNMTIGKNTERRAHGRESQKE